MTLPLCNDARGAADLLKRGHVIDYQPGDATRYECVRFTVGSTPYLAILNIGGWTVELRSRPLHGWIQEGLPRGSWVGLRPLLVALDVATGTTEMDPKDSLLESKERAHIPPGSHTAQRVIEDRNDKEVGRLVRNLLMSEGWTPSSGEHIS